MAQHYFPNCLFTSGNTFCSHSKVIQHTAARFKTQLIIISHQNIQVHEFIILDFLRILKLQVKCNCKTGTYTKDTFHLDITTHHTDNITAY